MGTGFPLALFVILSRIFSHHRSRLPLICSQRTQPSLKNPNQVLQTDWRNRIIRIQMRKENRKPLRKPTFLHPHHKTSQNVTHPDSDSLPVGWLIGYKGVYRGTLFSCHTGRNSIGKSSTSYIDLSCDSSIEDDIQALVIYDPHERQFFLQAGTGKGLVYHNDSLVFSHDLLEAYDHIQIGNTDLVFIPLCGPHFSWEEV